MGATYYVDYGSGSDAAAGTSTGAAWKHLPGDGSATGTPAAVSINGETIYLKGGVVYNIGDSNGVAVSSARYSNANGCTIASGDAVGWGVGRAIMDGAGVGIHWFQITAMTNVTLRGLELRNTVDRDNNAALYIFRSASNVVDSCVIHDCGTNLSNCHQDAMELSGDVVGAGYHIVTNCTIYNSTQKDIETHSSCLGNRIVNNYLGAASDHCITISSDLNTVSGNIISNAAAVNVWLQASTDPGYGIKLSSSSTTTCRSNLIFNNLVSHCNGGIVLENVGALDMNYNRVFNNTVVDVGYSNGSGSPSGLMRFNVTGTGVHNNTEVRNNIFYVTVNDTNTWRRVGIRCSALTGTNNFVSNNLFATTNDLMFAMISVGSTQQPTLANFSDDGTQSPDYRFAEPGHGTGNSFLSGTNQVFNSDPLLVSYPSDLRLGAGSPCIGTGTNLSAYFTTDIAGRTRISWSMGAYEYFPYTANTLGIATMGKSSL